MRLPTAPGSFFTSTQPRRAREAGRIELLEQRVTPAAIVTHWVGSSGNWTDAAHWDHGVPNNADGSGDTYTAIIDASALHPVVTINSEILLDSLINAESIKITGMTGPGTLVVYKAMDNTGSVALTFNGVFAVACPSLTTAQLGAIHTDPNTGGRFLMETNLDNTNATLVVDAPLDSWEFLGGKITGGSVVAGAAGSKILVEGSQCVLDGVTMNVDLKFPSSLLPESDPSVITVLHGLTLNATATLGGYSSLNFVDSQTLSGTGTIFFADGVESKILQSSTSNTAPVLTIATGITIHGGTSFGGYVSYAGPDQGIIINHGKISADVVNKSLVLASLVQNDGTLEAKNGGILGIEYLSTNSGVLGATGGSTLYIGGNHWTNTGTIALTDSSFDLYGGITTAELGTLQLSNASVFLRGTLYNTDATLTLVAGGKWILNGGEIFGGVIQSSGGTKLAVEYTGNRSELYGVTLNTDLDLSADSADVEIRQGLTLNGTITLGAHGFLNFVGTQTFDGTGSVVFQDSAANALALGGTSPLVGDTSAPTTLTIGSGITIRGGSSYDDGGQIGYSDFYGGTTNGTIVNEGTISADAQGRSLHLNQSATVNHGTIEAKDGGSLAITSLATSSGNLRATAGGTLTVDGDHWTNTGTLSETGGNLNLDGAITTAGLGTVIRGGGTAYLRGTLDNTGATFHLHGAAWHLSGTIKGGTVEGDTGGKLVSTGNDMLDGVTLNADLDLTEAAPPGIFGILATIRNGITLNGTATVGAQGFLVFDGTQTLGGTGAVFFPAGSYQSGLIVRGVDPHGGNPTLTIGSNMIIHGGSASSLGATGLGDSAYHQSFIISTIINEGTISADLPGGVLSFYTCTVVNHGAIEAKNGGVVEIPEFRLNDGTMSATGGSTLSLRAFYPDLGTLTSTDSTLILDGYLITAALAHTTITGGSVVLKSALFNSDSSSNVPAVLNLTTDWTLAGGQIWHGVVQSSNGSKLIATGVNNFLVGVTLNTDLNLTAGVAFDLNGIYVYDGLTLNGVATVSAHSALFFAESEALSGTGSVRFLDTVDSALYVNSGATFIIGPSMTIRGGSSHGDGGVIGYDPAHGTINYTVVNQGKISADVNGTSIKLPQGRFINTGTLEELNGGTIEAPTLATIETKVLTKTSKPYAFIDADGTPVTVKWLGAGSVTLVRVVDANPHADLFSITTNGSNLTSSLSIATTGPGATTNLTAIDIHGSLKSLTAPTTDFQGLLTSTNSIATLTLGQVTSSNIKIGPRAAGDTRTATTLTFDRVAELQIDSATPLLALTAAQWFDREGSQDFITAPSLGALTIKSAPARALASDFEASLSLGGIGVAAKQATLGAVNVAGKITKGSWSIGGLTTSVKAGSFTADWLANFQGPVGALTTTGNASGYIAIGPRAAGDLTSRTSLSFDTASELSIHSETPISSLTTRGWTDRDGTPDVIEAPSLGTLTVKGDTKVSRPLAGDFEADLTLSGDGVAPKAKTLGTANVKGGIDGSTWTVTGAAGALTAGSTGAAWNATFTKAITSVTASTLSGSLQAASIGTVKADNLTHFSLTLTQAVNPAVKALGTLTVKHAIDSSDIRAAGDIGTVTAAAILHSRLFAGVQASVSALPQSRADFAALASIAKVVVSGTANSADPGLVDSDIAASKIGSASITRFAASNNALAYGLAAESIGSLTLKTVASTVTRANLHDPTPDASAGGDDFFVRIV